MRELIHHAARRLEGYVTLSVLLGSPESGTHAWTRWATETSLEPVVCEEARDPFDALLEAVDQTEGFARRLLALVGTAHGLTPERAQAKWAETTVWDIELAWGRARPLDFPSPMETLARRTLVAQMRGLSLPSLREALPHDATTVEQLATVLEPSELPAVALLGSGLPPTTRYLVFAAALAAPSWPIGLLLRDRAELSTWTRELPDLYVTMLHEGALELPSSPELVPAPVAEPRWRSAMEARLATLEGEGPTMQELEGLEARHRFDSGNPRFRSSAELLLLGFLERWPETRGRFEPNARPGFRFRGRPAELDLFAESLGLVIELDGEAWHLPSDRRRLRTQYRVDREKDWLLQQRGLRVLRFLSEDIGPHMSAVEATIRAAALESPR